MGVRKSDNYERKSVRIQKPILRDVQKLKSEEGGKAEQGLSRIINRAILTYRDDRYNLKKKVKILRNVYGEDVEVDYARMSPDSETKTVNQILKNEVIEILENQKAREAMRWDFENIENYEGTRNMNMTEFLSFCVSNYVYLKRKEMKLTEMIDVDFVKLPDANTLQSIDWDEYKEKPETKIKILKNLILENPVNIDEENRIRLEIAATNYGMAHMINQKTAREHMKNAMKLVENESEIWRRSIKSKSKEWDEIEITKQDVNDEFEQIITNLIQLRGDVYSEILDDEVNKNNVDDKVKEYKNKINDVASRLESAVYVASEFDDFEKEEFSYRIDREKDKYEEIKESLETGEIFN